MNRAIRWIQRFENYKKALMNLTEAAELQAERALSKLEEQGLIKAFELVHELSWLTIKEYYENQGEVSIQGSRDAFRLAFKRGLILNGDVFMKSIKSRQLSVHTYNDATAEKLQFDILHTYFQEFQKLSITLEDLKIRAE